MLDAGAAAWIAEAFDLGGDARLSNGPVARGEQGQVWRLDTIAGGWAVKEAFRSVDPAELTVAADFADAARASGVPSPRARRDTRGRLMSDVAASGAQVQVSEWVDLLPPDPLLDPALVGRTVAGIHRTRVPARGAIDPWFTEPVGRSEWDSLGRKLFDAGAPFAGQFDQLRQEFVALDEWVRPPREVWTCHRDLWADNLRPTAGGGVCVIDWQDCGPADPGDELACTLVEFGAGDPARIAAIHDSYVEAGGPGRVAEPGDFSMLIAQLGHICRIACLDWLDPAARSTDRQHSAQRFAEFVDRPYTRAGLEHILNVLRGNGGTRGSRSATPVYR
jgi:hypothetical protein